MAKFIMTFSTDNAAFDENPAREVSRILAEVAARIESADRVPEYFENIRDINGNIVGTYAVKPDDYIQSVK